MASFYRNCRACILVGIDLVLLFVALPFVTSQRLELNSIRGTTTPVSPAVAIHKASQQLTTPVDHNRVLRQPIPKRETLARDLSVAASDPFIAEARRRALEDPAAAMLWIQNEASGAERLRGMLEVVALWAAEDSQNALLWLESNAQGLARLETLNSGMDLWSRQDPSAAAEWIEGMANDGSKITAVKALVDNWTTKDPQNAARWVASLPQDVIRDEAAAALVESWGEQDPEAATIWALSEAEFNGNRKLLNHSIRKFTATAPKRAEQFVRNITEAYRAPDVIRAYVETLAQQEPVGAARWLGSLSANDPLYNPRHAEILMREWSRSDSVAASAWLSEKAPGAERDAAILGFADTMTDFEPAAVTAWSNLISDPDQRLRSLQNSVAKWARTDPAEARDWLQNASIEPSLRQNLTRTIFTEAE